MTFRFRDGLDLIVCVNNFRVNKLIIANFDDLVNRPRITIDLFILTNILIKL